MSETTQQLTAVVTVGYTPIEQYNVSDAEQGPWTDIYALSAVLYEAVTGSMPVDSVTRASTTLTDAADPLVPVRNKSLHPCSDGFYHAIDWGLKMDPLQRPGNVSEWIAALDEQPKLETESAAPQNKAQIRKPDRPVRASRLRTREKTLAARETESHQRTSVELAMQDFDNAHQHGSRIEPSFSASLDDIDHEATEQLGSLEAGQETSVVNDNDRILRPDSATTGFSTLETNQIHETTEPAALLKDIPDPELRATANDSAATPASAVESAVASAVMSAEGAAPALSNGTGKSHTQEIRDVVRRDIMKRNVESAEIKTPPEEPGYHPLPPATEEPRKPGRILTRAGAGLDHQGDAASFGLPAQRESIQSDALHRDTRQPDAMQPDAMQIDQSDWDYEPPGSPSRWKWLIPAGGLLAVFAASLLYVNRPELFQFNKQSLPELTVDAALEQAQDKVASNQFIFPAGESALDYYQLVLGSDPNNSEALAGVELVEQQVRGEIVKNIEDNSLSEANRLLSRANKAGLRIDDVPATGGNNPTRQVTAIDQDLSPYVQRKIAEIERQIERGDAEAAQALFTETDKFLPDAEVSSNLQRRIQAIREEKSQSEPVNIPASPSTITDAGDQADPELTQPTLATTEPVLDSAAGIAITAPPVTNSISKVTGNPYTNTESPARSAQTVAETNDLVAISRLPEPALSGTDTPNADDTDAVADAVNARRSDSEPPPPISAPRRSFVEGSGESAQHLNRLRTAIEAKSINRVLQISNDLPRERLDFLQQLFSRYDRLDVVIDRVRDQSGELTARLNVSMFNKRNDGSFYSAGRWNGVTVRSSKIDEQWQKIEW